MDINEARQLTGLHLLRTDRGDPPLSVAPWAWTNGADWLTHANTEAALEGQMYYGVMDAPFYLVAFNGEVTELDHEEAQERMPTWTRVGPPEPPTR